jgi:hypothetical protein
MNKTQLTVHISNLLKGAIEAYEAADLCLEENDMGALYSIHDSLEIAVKYLRIARRMGQVLQEQYEENLEKKPEYLDLPDSIDEDDEVDS